MLPAMSARKNPAPPPSTEPRDRKQRHQRLYLHLLIAVAAVMLRLYFTANAQWFARSDTRNFHEYACNLLSGRPWGNFWFEDPRFAGYAFRQYHAPGYPLLLTATYALTGFDKEAYLKSPMANVMTGANPWRAVGFNPRHMYTVHILLDLLTMAALVGLAYRYFDARCAFGVQVISALSVMWTPVLISETLFNAAFASGLWAAGTNPGFTARGRNLAFSLALLVAVMTKPMGIVLAGAAGLPLLRRLDIKGMLRLAALGIPLALYIAVMFWNSHRIYGRAFFMSNRGEALAVNTYLPELYVPYEQAYGYLKEKLGRIPMEWEVNDRYQEVFRERIRAQPSLLVRNYVKNFTSLFSLKPDWWLEQWTWPATFYFAPEVGAWHRRFFTLHYLTYPLGILGLLALGRRSPMPALTALLFLLLHPLVTFGHFRYMAPVALIFGWYAGVVLGRLPDWLRAPAQPPDGRSAQTKA